MPLVHNGSALNRTKQTEKQKYILNLAERYNEIKEEYYKQKKIYV